MVGVDLSPADHGEDGGSQNYCRRIVRKQRSDDRTNQIDQDKQSPWRVSCVLRRHISDPLEDSFLPRHFSENHHPRQEEIDVQSFVHRMSRLRQ